MINATKKAYHPLTPFLTVASHLELSSSRQAKNVLIIKDVVGLSVTILV